MTLVTNKYLWALLLMLACGLGGFYAGRGQKAETITIHDVQTVTKFVDHIVTVTKTIHANGTTTETTKTEDKENDKTVQDNSRDTTTTPVSSNYSIGVRYHLEPLAFADTIANPYKGLEITAGRRILGDVWIDAGVEPINREISLGIRIDL